MVAYTGRNHAVPRYCCRRGHLDSGDPRCISLGGIDVDEAVARELLRVVQPAGIEAAVLAASEQTDKHAELLDALLIELKAARYAADRAFKQYDGVDPDNRLVTDELERRWNAALERVRALEKKVESEQQLRHTQGEPPTTDALTELAMDLERVWSAPETDVRLKKRIVRTLIEEVAVDVDAKAGEITLVIHWKGGVHSELRVPRRRRGQNRIHAPLKTVEAVRTLAHVCSDDLIASYLNRNGIRTGRGNRWTRERVASLRSKRKIPRHTPHRQQTGGWMNLGQAASHVGVSPKTLRRAAERSAIAAQHPLPDGPWVFNQKDLDAFDVEQRSLQTPAGPHSRQLALTIPKT